MTLDPRFTSESKLQLLRGPEALVRGALEAREGVQLITGYLSAPLAEVFDCARRVQSLLEERGTVVRTAANENVAVGMMQGAQLAQCRAMLTLSCSGFATAAEPLALAMQTGVHDQGGALIVIGEDEAAAGSQRDVRAQAQQIGLPMLEPSSMQEVKDWVGLALDFSAQSGSHVGMLLRRGLVHGGGTVECEPFSDLTSDAAARVTLTGRDLGPWMARSIPLAPRVAKLESEIPHRHGLVLTEAREAGVNAILHQPRKDEITSFGVVAVGSAYGPLIQAMAELGLEGRLPLLKLGLVHPVDGALVAKFAKQCRQLLVVEQGGPFVENQIAAALARVKDAPGVFGKQLPGGQSGIPSRGTLTPSMLIQKLAPMVRDHPTLPAELTQNRLGRVMARMDETARSSVVVPPRTPTFCSGCPHRDSSSVLQELQRDLLDANYMLHKHKSKPVQLLVHGDAGCSSLMRFEPNSALMHSFGGQGLGGAVGSGAGPFVDNRQLVLLGEGSFFHSGQATISHSIHNGEDVTYLLMDNRTAALAGQRPHVGSDTDVLGRERFALDVERTIRGMIPKQIRKEIRIVRMNPEDRQRYRNLLEQAILAPGVSIVVADKACGIIRMREARKSERQQVVEQGFVSRKTHMNIASSVCENCLACTSRTGCPSLVPVMTEYGAKVQTDLSTCTDDGACSRLNVCPSFEEVTVVRRQRPRGRADALDVSGLPDPPKPVHANQEAWRCAWAGVGGMGVRLGAWILAYAGQEMGYHVQIVEHTGVAVRTGPVYAQLVYARSKPAKVRAEGAGGDAGEGGMPRPSWLTTTTASMVYGQADLLMGADLLEAARCIDAQQTYRVAAPDRTATVLNTTPTPTRGVDADSTQLAILQDSLRASSRDERFYAWQIGEICEQLLGSRLYMNVAMIGAAFQLGLLPLKREALEAAVMAAVPDSEREPNLRALQLGRQLAAYPQRFARVVERGDVSTRATLRRKVRALRQRFSPSRGRRYAKKFLSLALAMHRGRPGQVLPEQMKMDLLVRTYDALIWGGPDYAREYVQLVEKTLSLDKADRGFELTHAVILNLARVMLIKDETYVSLLLTDPEKYERDRKRFRVDTTAGDKLIYKHFHQVNFELFGHRFNFDWHSRDWHLQLLTRGNWLRKITRRFHAPEFAYRDWYMQQVERVGGAVVTDVREYQRWVSVLATPSQVTGFGDVKLPKIEAARRRAEQLLNLDREQFEPGEGGSSHDSDMRLPVIQGAG